MPRLAAEQWAEIRVRREAGESFGSLGKAFGVNEAAIFRRSKKEGWGDGVDVGAAVRRRVNERVNGVVHYGPLTEPQSAIQRQYDELYPRFLELYPRLKEDFHWLGNF